MYLQTLLDKIELDDDDLSVAKRVLERAQSKRDGSYAIAGYVIRGDAKYVGPRTDSASLLNRAWKPDKHCIFINFPYLSLQKLPSNLNIDPELHYARGLLQNAYRLESTRIREMEQAICMELNSKKRVICVPQLWTIIIGSGKLLVYHEVSSLANNDLQN